MRATAIGKELMKLNATNRAINCRPFHGLDGLGRDVSWGCGYAFTPGFMLPPAFAG